MIRINVQARFMHYSFTHIYIRIQLLNAQVWRTERENNNNRICFGALFKAQEYIIIMLK